MHIILKTSPKCPLTFFLLSLCLSGDVQSCTASLWWSISWTVKERPASTRHPSRETPPGTVCPPAASLFPADPPRRVPIACRASRSSSTLRPPSHAAPLSTGSCRMDPGIASDSCLCVYFMSVGWVNCESIAFLNQPELWVLECTKNTAGLRHGETFYCVFCDIVCVDLYDFHDTDGIANCNYF